MKLLRSRSFLLLLIWGLSVSGLSPRIHAAELDSAAFSSAESNYQSESSDPPEEDSEEDDEPDCD